MEKQKKLIYKCLIGIFTVAMMLPIFSGFAITVKAAGKVTEIKDIDDLINVVILSEKKNYEGETIVLINDIIIDDAAQAQIDKYEKHLTIGRKDNPFKGTFDGQNHTIKGLKYDPNIVKDANSGFFSFIENATIKNLIVENADIDCIFQGGIIVGHAQDSTLENITVLNSKLKISPANNVVSLVTNGGFAGGGIAGIVEDSLLYNCEVSGTEVVNNSTAGVTGVGGEGLYMGGLVGWASGSTIEYCRARANYDGEGDTKELRNTVVRNKYDIAVGALGGKSVYAGGIVGGVNNGCFIFDCFSTADVSFDVANYVAVASGIAGYGGGITGALRGNSMIDRCHYAGNIHSKQYNAILVIPIIQYDVNINGIARICEEGSAVLNSYFKPSAIESGVSISAIGGKPDTEFCGARDDATYIDTAFWEGKEYDFIGNKPRQTPPQNFDKHYNKWVMDYDLGIPVHGKSAMATFDFPGSGKVKIEKTALVNVPVETDDLLSFAMQGVHPREEQAVTLTMELNDRYRLESWYKKSVMEKHEVSDIEEILAITQGEGEKLEGNETTKRVPIEDRDLFVAGVEANVTFYEVDGQKVVADEWYKYGATMAEHTPSEIKDSKFYGWTTIPNPSDKEDGYSSITSTELNDIKQQGEFYPNGAEVKKEMKLYPIYINSLINVGVEFEGHEQDDIDDNTKRDGVGKTVVGTDENGDVYIDVQAEDETKNFPTGYQFRGWYKKQTDGTEVCVSREYRYKVPELTDKVTYVARFNYAVEYWIKAFDQKEGHSFTVPELYATIMHTYKEGFQNIGGPAYAAEEVVGWGHEHFDHTNQNCTKCYDESKLIVEPIKVSSHNQHSNDNVADNYPTAMSLDFPGSGKVKSEKVGIGDYTFQYVPINPERYNFQFWTLEKIAGVGKNEGWTYKANPMTVDFAVVDREHSGYGMISTDVVFHDANGTEKSTVQRRYNDQVFVNDPTEHTYKYPFLGDDVDTWTEDGYTISGKLNRKNAPTDEDMERDGYQFLGWISGSEVEKDGAEWNYIYDVQDDTYCTSDIEKVEPYLLKTYDGEHSSYLEDRLQVKETMDVYPVYAKYDVTTTTNIHQIENLPAGVNLPNKPKCDMEKLEGEFGKANVTVTAENEKTSVLKAEPNGKKYKFMSLICEADGVQQVVETTQNENGDYVYTGEIIAGKPYKFTAIYSPAFVQYHMDDNGTINSVVKDMGERLGASPSPDFGNIAGIEKSYFAGWTQQKPESGNVWKLNSKADLDNSGISFTSPSTVVKESMDLWPVFVNASITVDSNIDNILGDSCEQYRRLVRNADGSMQLEAKDYQGYVFKGWYTDYESDDSLGNLVSESMTVKLSQEQLSEEKHYTAVFKSAKTVNYRNMAGDVIYTVNVESGTRSFVDKDGNAIDTEPILILNESLKENEVFNEWQWKSGDQMIPWDEFKDNTITENMDIYPYIVSVKAYDSSKQEYEKVKFQVVNPSEKDPQEKENYLLTGLFTDIYKEPNLTVKAERYVWNPEANEKMSIPIVELPTKMYIEATKDGEYKYIEASQGPVYTDGLGEALHEFFGKVKLTKKYTDVSVNDVVYVDIVDTVSGVKRRVPIEVSDGNGTVTVHLPVGTYQIMENTAWSWRDEVDSVTNVDEQNNITINIGAEEEVTIQNKRVNEKWFDGTDRKKNIYQK